MPEPTEGDIVDVAAELFLAFIILFPVIEYLFVRKWPERSNKRETELPRRHTEDDLTSEITAYLFSPPTSLTKSADACITKNVYGLVENKNVCATVKNKNVCAVCPRPGPFRCKLCKSAHYCSFKCQLKHWRQGHKYECKECSHDSGASSYGKPATEASQHMRLSCNLNSPLGDTSDHLHDRSSDTLSESSFRATDSNLDTESNQSRRHTNEQDAIGVSCENNHYSSHEVTCPEILLVNKVSDNDLSCSDVVSGNFDVTYPINAQQPTICAPETGNRKNASITSGIPDKGVNLTSDMIGSCSGTNSFMKQEGTYVSTSKPLQRTLSYRITIEQKALDQLLIDGRAKPMMLSYEVLKDITNNFSEVIGSGGSGEVYMGVLENGNVAVKKLYNTEAFTEKQFEDELTCLIRVEHKNIVRLLGYCSDIQQKVVEYSGRLVLADIRRRFLCLEYAPNKSLADYLKDESRGHDWDTRYQLIEGICRGLHYLHKKESITHMDLKPANILLDANMVPKITDFGLSRRFSGAESRIITKHLCGSLGYIAPELLERGEISLKSDIFSLGIIIRNILRGSTSLSDFENWHESLDVDCPRFKRCIEIAQLCVNYDPRKRPTMDCIMGMLNTKEKVFQEASPVIGQSLLQKKERK